MLSRSERTRHSETKNLFPDGSGMSDTIPDPIFVVEKQNKKN